MQDTTECINSIGYAVFAVIKAISINRNGLEMIMYFMFSFISFRRNINYLLPRLLNFWKPDTLPRTTNCYDVHAYMPQHQYLAFFVYIITVYTSLYYILKHKISKRNNIYVCDGKHRLGTFSLFIRQNFITKIFYSQPASFVPNVVPCL